MAHRKKLIEDIFSNFHVFGHKCKLKPEPTGEKPLITHAQWYVLCSIDQSKTTNVKDMAHSMSISPSAITQLVDGLVDTGLVTRREDPVDRRTTQLSLSSKGKKHLQLIKKKKMESLISIFEVLSDTELATFHKLQQKLLTQFSQ